MTIFQGEGDLVENFEVTLQNSKIYVIPAQRHIRFSVISRKVYEKARICSSGFSTVSNLA